MELVNINSVGYTAVVRIGGMEFPLISYRGYYNLNMGYPELTGKVG